MYIRTFFFLIFIISSAIFFISSYNPYLTRDLCGSMCEDKLSINYIQLISMLTSAFSILTFGIANYYTEKKILAEKKRLEADRLNIEEIHAELEALRQ